MIIPDRVKNILNKPGTKAFFCPFCKRLSVSPANLKINTVMCPMCASFERHRLLYFIYNAYINLREPINILHLAPEKSLSDLFCSYTNIEYVCADLIPEYFPFAPNIRREDAMNLSFADESFDFVLHNHIIEHVSDDKKVIRECLRVLKNEGKFIMCFPYYPDRKSDFDFTVITPQDRAERFGWHDHLRLYGYDFLNYLTGDSYIVKVLYSKDNLNLLGEVVSAEERRWLALDAANPNDCVVLLEKLR
jgi:SAM-dependent methyltransferase